MSDNTECRPHLPTMQAITDTRTVTRIGHSYYASLPKEELRERGLINDDDELVEDLEATPFVDGDELVLRVSLD